MADIVLITGLSGAGRSAVADVLEDLGWFVVDNLPTALIGTIVELAAKPTSDIERLALVAGRQHTEVLSKVGELRADGHDVRTVFLDVSTPELVLDGMTPTLSASPLGRRCRSNPSSRSSSNAELLAPVRDAADLVIDTSDLNVHQLKDCIDHAVDAPTGSPCRWRWWRVSDSSTGFRSTPTS